MRTFINAMFAFAIAITGLTGCGESAGDYARNEKTRSEVRDAQREQITQDDRITALEKRVQALEAGR